MATITGNRGEQARESTLKAEQQITFDGGFTCIGEGEVRTALSDAEGLYFDCRCGKHRIAAQLGDGDAYVGIFHLAV